MYEQRLRSHSGVFLHWRSVRADRAEGPRAALLGEPISFPESGEESVGESRLSAERNRADFAREAPVVHGEIHDRRRAAEIARASQGGSVVAYLSGRACDRNARVDRTGSSRSVASARTHTRPRRGAALMRLLLTNDDGIL